MIDEKQVYLARNALLVAGMEMGKEGDHWPVIKANIHALMHDFEQLKIETAVFEELREHLGTYVKEYERLMTICKPETRAQAEPLVKELREMYEAAFAPVDTNHLATHEETTEAEDGKYVPWKSSAAIIETLTEDRE